MDIRFLSFDILHISRVSRLVLLYNRATDGPHRMYNVDSTCKELICEIPLMFGELTLRIFFIV